MSVIPWPLKPAPKPLPHAAEDTAGMAASLIQSRQTVLPKRLSAPGPSPAELERILDAAAHAPDHGQTVPWRFVLVPDAARASLAEVLDQELLERDPASPAREKASRSPALMLAVVDTERGDAGTGLGERLVSAGCAVQNMLLMATAQGYGSAVIGGKALEAAGLRALFQLGESEQAVCFISIGTVQARKAVRARPAARSYVSTLDMERGVRPGF